MVLSCQWSMEDWTGKRNGGPKLHLARLCLGRSCATKTVIKATLGQHLNAGKFQFIFCALADLVTGKLLGYMFEQVDPQAAFLTRALGQADAEREEIFRR